MVNYQHLIAWSAFPDLMRYFSSTAELITVLSHKTSLIQESLWLSPPNRLQLLLTLSHTSIALLQHLPVTYYPIGKAGLCCLKSKEIILVWSNDTHMGTIVTTVYHDQLSNASTYHQLSPSPQCSRCISYVFVFQLNFFGLSAKNPTDGHWQNASPPKRPFMFKGLQNTGILLQGLMPVLKFLRLLSKLILLCQLRTIFSKTMDFSWETTAIAKQYPPIRGGKTGSDM